MKTFAILALGAACVAQIKPNSSSSSPNNADNVKLSLKYPSSPPNAR